MSGGSVPLTNMTYLHVYSSLARPSGRATLSTLSVGLRPLCPSRSAPACGRFLHRHTPGRAAGPPPVPPTRCLLRHRPGGRAGQRLVWACKPPGKRGTARLRGTRTRDSLGPGLPAWIVGEPCKRAEPGARQGERHGLGTAEARAVT